MFSPPILEGAAVGRCYFAFLHDQVGTLDRIRARYGPLVVLRDRMSLRRRVRQGVVVSAAEFNRQVLSDTETYQSGGFSIRGPRGSAQNRLRKGLVGINGEKHRHQSRLVSPLFAPRAAQQHFPTIASIVSDQLDRWTPDRPIDVAERVSRMSLLVSAHTLLSGEDLDESIRLAEQTADLLAQGFSSKVWLLPVNLPGTPFRKLLQGAERLEAELLRVFDRRQQTAHDSQHLFDRLISAHLADPAQFSRNEVVGQMVLLFGASHETTAKAVMWTLFLLAQHPRIMSELRQEIVDRCADRPPRVEEISQFPLLDAITKESMRLLPPVPWIARRVRSDARLGGVRLKNRDYVLLSIYGTHRDPDVFPQPNQFRPERWFEGAPDSYAYLPFSAGPRTCIGKSLGTLIINTMVAMTVQRYALAMVPGSRIDRQAALTLAPKYGLPMNVHPPVDRVGAIPVRGNIHQLVDLSRSDASTFPATIPLRRSDRTPVPLRRAA